jgi:flavin-dependent dehydrogenase
VVIVGGGPVGSTVSTLLRKYDPALDVLVVEKEKFPRDHVGESQLPGVSAVLDEMGCWDKVEAANFPIKIGLSLTWGKNPEQWDFDFYPSERWKDEPRPTQYAGQRRSTAFQVDRARYDDILLRHAESLGVEVREQTRVAEVLVDGDRIEGLVLDNGETVTGRHYVDGSGAVGLLRRALGVEVDAPKELRNIAIWDYWENAAWAVEIGVGATRVQVRSLPYGWLWFIPLGPTRTSIGLICPSDYYRESGKSPEQLYEEAIAAEKHISRLTEGGTRRGEIETCKDWSHLADRLVGENWFLAGEAAGFADPILAAGMALAHASARDVAYTILELERGRHDAAWLKDRFDQRNRTNIGQHIRFAQYWYSANGCFTDLQDYCAAIAKEAGLRLTPQQAWRWLSQGGFTAQNLEAPAAGSFDFGSAKEIVEWFDGKNPCERLFEGHNVFKLKLDGATEGWFGRLAQGRIERVKCLTRGENTLPLHGYYGMVVAILREKSDVVQIMEVLKHHVAANVAPPQRDLAIERFFQSLDAMIQEGWVTRKRNKKRPIITRSAGSGRLIRTAAEGEQALADADVSFKSNLELDED